MADMTEILRLVRDGRLGAATDEIQRTLRDRAAGRTPEPPMKDVTPIPTALPGAVAAPPNRGKRVRPRKAAWHAAGAEGRPVTAPALPSGAEWLSQQGALPYRLFVPSAPAAEAPVIVMLHGCTQTPEDFAAGTAICAAADAIGAHVIFPEQTRRTNANLCWSWFEPAHQGRSGEAQAIVAITESVRAGLGAPRPVHVAGLSAGGAMAAILGARYPEVVRSVAIHSGLPVGAARDLASAFAAMKAGGPSEGPLPVPAIVFHGMADRTVAPANGAAFLADHLGQADISATERGGRRATISAVAAPVRMELWEIEGLGHAWSGGDPRGSYADPVGPDATAEMMRFFAQTR
ncbi:extracellular catalytic domain type 1 short-chain-length polyhydroxyalkanoate depolymerase [Jannaschia seohaensis]|uniref:Esterase, PHB depolymerase family n=1 Tax=Jannaschia seohaensis TaxID=475081 RepID=A0A2Y9A796_9RHOB|nr:PHB depolymerase family esterase [Jannaschia seohaensis]PWJ21769.1 poly(hydroxyalkanoate) depolymerase family esterase [Jannaschia seohaensis]SSA38047.1 esterase, PHB depolymerase family [Jannaschia seohaensis]